MVGRAGAERAITLKMEIPGPMPPLIREMLENPEAFDEQPEAGDGPAPPAITIKQEREEDEEEEESVANENSSEPSPEEEDDEDEDDVDEERERGADSDLEAWGALESTGEVPKGSK